MTARPVDTVAAHQAAEEAMDKRRAGAGWDQPPCSTCGGTHRVWLPTPTYGSPRYHARPCPDCETT